MTRSLRTDTRYCRRSLTLAFEEAFQTGLIDRPVELVIREVDGPPDGAFAAVRRAWRELVEDEMVLATVGPFITDTTLALRDDIERAKVPCLSYCATTGFDGQYTFQLPNGTFADETFHVARRRSDCPHGSLQHE